MPISKSSYALGTPREDGLVKCTETFVTEFGTAITSYVAPVDSDWALHLKDTAEVIKQRLVLQEFEWAKHAEIDGPLVLKNQTVPQFLSRLRTEYRDASKAAACFYAWYMLRRLELGHITEAQLRTAFGGLTVEKWNILKATRLSQQSRAWKALTAVLGE